MKNSAYYIINGITLYRTVTAPVLILLIILDKPEIFKWLLVASFFTDAIDGWLARRFHITSLLGARLDSMGDDLTVFVSIVAMLVWKGDFMNQHTKALIFLAILFFIQVSTAYVRYGKMTCFHTYLAKIAAVCQGVFLILSFFLSSPLNILFYLAIGITALELVEETILVMILPEWKINVKGLYWIVKNKSQAKLYN